ncbi:MAG: hypothetical protein PVI90_02215 [Desulfobacteraceae bacterium]
MGIIISLFLLWNLFLWGSARMLIRKRIRPVRVVIQSRNVLMGIGAILFFDFATVPIILVSLSGAALFCLGTCVCVALLHLICVNDGNPDAKHDLFL